MLVPICEIKINPGRRKVEAKDVQDLAKSISQVGLLNPITVTPDHTLIAGNHRLEAAKLLEWTEIECTVCDVSGLLVELAEIDENFVRVNLSPIEFGDLLLRRKEIYEALHPEAKHGGDLIQPGHLSKILPKNSELIQAPSTVNFRPPRISHQKPKR